MLFLCLGGVVLYNFAILGKKGDPPQAKSGREDRQLPPLRLGLLSTGKAPYKGVKRDLFSPPESPARKAAPAPKPQELPPPMPEVPAPPPPSEIQVFASEARFIGFLDSSSSKSAFIMRGADVYIIKKGDSIRSRFNVEEVSGGFITLKDSETGEEAMIRLPVQR
ncbi:MAG: hypothetical protein H3C68_03585 [Deltaproteobacteria bacterium]|nr:hypothetical protein [Deltaproteobacteria bacterium]